MNSSQLNRVLEACDILTQMECSCCFEEGFRDLTQEGVLYPDDLPILAGVLREDAREDWADEEEFKFLLDTCAEVCRQFIYIYDDFEEIHEQARLNALGALIILGRFDIIQKLPAWATATYFRAKEV